MTSLTSRAAASGIDMLSKRLTCSIVPVSANVFRVSFSEEYGHRQKRYTGKLSRELSRTEVSRATAMVSQFVEHYYAITDFLSVSFTRKEKAPPSRIGKVPPDAAP